jgi:flotillin
MESIMIIGGIIVFVLFLIFLVFVSRYKRCPSDKVLVVYGKTNSNLPSKCIHGGAAFVIPVFQDYGYLNLQPQSIDVDMTGALSKQNIRVNVPSQFTVGISTEEGIMENAADRLLGLHQEDIKDLAENIITGQLRLVVATMDIEEINSDRDKFLESVTQNVETELKKIGLKLINVNITDIQDESGYIEALGKEAAAKAINDAKKSVAEKNRDGSIGSAIAEKEERIQVSESVAQAMSGEADASRLQRVRVAKANAEAVEGENESLIAMAQSNALRREQEAEALRRAVASEKIQQAKALEEAYVAEKLAEEARAHRELAAKRADIVVQAEIEKQQKVINAEAEAERIRMIAKGQADAIFMQKEAEAKGLFEILNKQAEGFDSIVEAANGNPKDAVMMLIADKLEELVKTQVDAVKGMKIDKVTVWENGGNGDGKTATSNFVSGLYKSVPPLKDLFDMAGMDLPKYLGSEQKEDVVEETPKTEE